MKMFLLWTALASSNFLWQAFMEQQWRVAIERSYFQGVAVLAVVVVAWLTMPVMPAHAHQWSPWGIERRVLRGPYGVTEDDVMRRRCTDQACALVQQLDIKAKP